MNNYISEDPTLDKKTKKHYSSNNNSSKNKKTSETRNNSIDRYRSDITDSFCYDEKPVDFSQYIQNQSPDMLRSKYISKIPTETSNLSHLSILHQKSLNNEEKISHQRTFGKQGAPKIFNSSNRQKLNTHKSNEKSVKDLCFDQLKQDLKRKSEYKNNDYQNYNAPYLSKNHNNAVGNFKEIQKNLSSQYFIAAEFNANCVGMKEMNKNIDLKNQESNTQDPTRKFKYFLNFSFNYQK